MLWHRDHRACYLQCGTLGARDGDRSGAGQIATARRKDRRGLVDHRIGNASETGFEPDTFDRVVIALALHEMPRELRISTLREAARVCRTSGRVVAVEHARLSSRWASFLRSLWWFTWVPGNPEASTSADLQQQGLVYEMSRARLRVIETRTTKPEWIEGATAEP